MIAKSRAHLCSVVCDLFGDVAHAVELRSIVSESPAQHATGLSLFRPLKAGEKRFVKELRRRSHREIQVSTRAFTADCGDGARSTFRPKKNPPPVAQGRARLRRPNLTQVAGSHSVFVLGHTLRMRPTVSESTARPRSAAAHAPTVTRATFAASRCPIFASKHRHARRSRRTTAGSGPLRESPC